jgi:uncharacterized Zn-finger protein
MRDARQTGYTPVQVPGVTPEERITVQTRAVPCDGGGVGTPFASHGDANGNPDVLGHPRVWLWIAEREVTCPYCSRTYVLAEGAGDDGHH